MLPSSLRNFCFLSRLYQYSIRLLDRGGGKIYSSGSLDFRCIYISIVLFQGAYIWIKFRDVAPESNQRPPKGLRRESRVNELGEKVYCGNFEPLFKPPGSKNNIYFGRYEKEEDAEACRQILAFWYGKKGARGELPLGDGTTYTIAPVPEEAKCLGPEEKKEWAKTRVKEVLADYQARQGRCDPEAHRTAKAFPPVRRESPDADARLIVTGGSSGVQADDTHPSQLGNQVGDLVPSTSPSNSLNVAPGTELMHHLTFNDTPSDSLGTHPFQLSNQGGDLVPYTSPSNSLNVAPRTEWMHHLTFNDTPSDSVGTHPFQLGNQGGDLIPYTSPSNRLNVASGTEWMHHLTFNDTPSDSVGTHPFQLGNQGGDLVPSTSPSNSLNVAPEWMQYLNDTPSDSVGGYKFILTPPETIARSQPEAATNIATIRTGLYRKSRTELGERVYYGNFEPRFKPPGSKYYVFVGCYEKEEDAKACYQILASWYGKKGARGELPLGDGSLYPIPGMPEQTQRLGLMEKMVWAKKSVRQVLLEYQLWQCVCNPEAHRTTNALPPVLPESPDAGARLIVPGGSSGVQADDAHPSQLGNQGGELVPSASPSNILNEVPGTDGMQHHTPNDTPSGGVGGDALNFPSPESIARSHREAATNIATSGTGESNEQPLQPQRPETRLQGNQANDSTVHMIVDDFSVQRQVKELQKQVKELQRKRKESQLQAECNELQIKQLETLRSSLESQKVQWQSQKQQMENQVSELQRDQELLLLQNQQKETRIQEQDSRILELESANDVLESTHITRKRRCTGVTPTHD